jgi:hypothetical protein
LNAAETELDFVINYSGLTGTFSATHFHNAPAGVNGGIVHDVNGVFSSPSGTIVGSWKSTDAQALTPFLVSELRAGRLYYNIHTTPNFGGGEIRGQVLLQTVQGATTGVTTIADGAGNEVQTLAFGNEVQTLTLVSAGSTTLLFDGASATLPLTVALGANGTTAAAVLASLNTIPTLNGNVTVSGNNGGPFAITFVGALAGHDVNHLLCDNGTATTATAVEGAGVGTFTAVLAGTAAPAPLAYQPSVNEARLLRFNVTGNAVSAGTSSFKLEFGGTQGSTATQLFYTAGVSPTAADVLALLEE